MVDAHHHVKLMADDKLTPDGKLVADGRELYDPRYLRGIALFNNCEFFETHDTWEDLWTEYRGPARKFYQGIIQAAVALYHFGNGNLRGAKKVFLTSRNYLQAFQPFYLGLDLDSFLVQYERCFAEILAHEEDSLSTAGIYLEIDPELIPEIQLFV